MGRFGSFWAQSLSKKFEILVASRNPAYQLPLGCQRASLEELGSCDIVFLCVTMRATEQAIKILVPHLKKGSVLADTCSVKLAPLAWMQKHVPEECGILACHPMFGPESAKAGLQGLNIMLDPVRIPQALYQELLAGLKSLGLQTVEMSCQEHDEGAAWTQALTHFVGRSLMRLGMEDSPIATRWYQALQSVARQCVRDTPALFTDMQTLNPYAQDMRKKVMASFQETMRELEQGKDPPEISIQEPCADVIDVGDEQVNKRR